MSAPGTRRETGNRYAHEVATGYRYQSRVSGPIMPMDAPRNRPWWAFWRTK